MRARPTYTFECNGAKITVQQETGWTVSDHYFALKKLSAAQVFNVLDEIEINRASVYMSAVARTVSIEGDLGFQWVTAASPIDELITAYTEFADRADLVSAYIAAFYVVESLVPGDEDTSPLKKTVNP